MIVYEPSLAAYLPLRIYKRLVFRFGQILHAPVANGEELQQKDQLVFFNLMLMNMRRVNICDRLVQPHPFGILGALPHNTSYCEFGTYITELSRLNNNEIFESINDKYKKAIKHAINNKGVVRTGWENFDTFYPILESTLNKAGIGVECKEYFLRLHDFLGDKYSTLAVVYDQDRLIGGAVFLHSRYAAYCTHAANINETKLYGAMKLLHYEMMLHFKAQNVKRYDLVGVRLHNDNPSLEGIFRFKKGFGGKLKTGYLWKTDIRPAKLKVYDWIQQVRRRRNKIKDIIDQVNR